MRVNWCCCGGAVACCHVLAHYRCAAALRCAPAEKLYGSAGRNGHASVCAADSIVWGVTSRYSGTVLKLCRMRCASRCWLRTTALLQRRSGLRRLPAGSGCSSAPARTIAALRLLCSSCRAARSAAHCCSLLVSGPKWMSNTCVARHATCSPLTHSSERRVGMLTAAGAAQVHRLRCWQVCARYGTRQVTATRTVGRSALATVQPGTSVLATVQGGRSVLATVQATPVPPETLACVY